MVHDYTMIVNGTSIMCNKINYSNKLGFLDTEMYDSHIETDTIILWCLFHYFIKFQTCAFQSSSVRNAIDCICHVCGHYAIYCLASLT